MEKQELVFEGQSKRLYSTSRENIAVLEFKDDLSDGSGKKKGKIPGKGDVNAGISSFLFQYLENYHVPTHFIERISAVEMMVRRLRMLPIAVVVHNVATGEFAQRFKIDEGKPLDFPVIEHFLKAKKLGYPMINETHALALGYSKADDMKKIIRMASKTNAILKSLFDRRGMILVQFTLEFGHTSDHLYVGDEITPDSCKIWDKRTNRKLDKDRFLLDLGGVEKAYKELFERLTCAT